MVDAVDLTSTRAEEWALLGAGRANAVFAYKGKRGELAGQVLRLSKPRQKPRPPDAVSLEEAVWGKNAALIQPDPTQRACAFISQLATPMLGAKYIAQQVPADVTPDLARALLAAASPQAEATSCSATLMSDHTLFAQPRSGAPTLCVELKPKWGCLPTTATIHPDNRLKRQRSKFQLQQALKLAQGKVSQLSSYDPLDLFSGKEERVTAALKALLRKPQNNFRLFRDGQAHSFSGTESPEGQEELAHTLAGWASEAAEAAAAAILLPLLTQILQREEVLRNILRMQQLDAHDIEGVYPLYKHLLQQQDQQQQHRQSAQPPQSPKQRPLSPQQRRLVQQHSPQQASPLGRQPVQHQQQHAGSLASPPSPMAQVLQHTCCRRRRCSAGERLKALAECQEARAALLALPQPEALAVLRDYMTAATAKDCSVMITMRRLPGGDVTPSDDALGVAAVGSQYFEYKVAVADLDLKPLEKIDEHYELDCAIMHEAKQQRLAALLS